MARGFIGGMVWGGIAGVGGVAAMSLILPLPQAPNVDMSASEAVVQISPEAAGETGVDAGRRDVDLAGAHPTTPGAGQPPDDVASLNTDPSPLPNVGSDGADLTESVGPAEADDIDARTDTPIGPSRLELAPTPAAPTSGPQLSISTEPAQPVLPDIGQTEAGFGRAPDVTSEAPQVQTSVDTVPNASDVPVPEGERRKTTPSVSTIPALPLATASDAGTAPRSETARVALLPQTAQPDAGPIDTR